MRTAVGVALVVLFAVQVSGEVRTWKDKSGKFSIQAELVESDGTAVKLKKVDGKMIRVPLERLSDADRQFLESQEKNAFSDAPPQGSMSKGASGANTPGLHYGWKAGQQYMYKVKIEVDLGDEVLEMTGIPSYTVRSTDKDRTVLVFRGTLMDHTRSKGGGPAATMHGRGRMGPPPHPGPRMHSPFSPMTGVGPFGMARETELTVDPLGNVARQEGTSQLPFLLGNLSHLMIEPLPEGTQQSWTVAHGSGVVIKEGGPPRFGPRANDEGFVPASEKTTYTIESTGDKAIVIRKEYEFKAAATGTDKPPFEIAGDGKYTFNKAEGVSGSLDFTMKVTFRKGGVSLDVPVKATYQLVDEAEKAAMAKAAKDAEAERKKPLDDKQVNDLAAALKSGQRDKQMQALRQLTMKSPDKPDEEIAKALEQMALDSSNIFRGQAARALEKWSTPANVPGLVKMLADRSVRNSAMKALARQKAPEAIEPVAKQLGELGGDAAEYLKAVGPAAESAVAKQLGSLSPEARRRAAEILKDIGTEKSLAALEKAAGNDPDEGIQRIDEEAMRAIKRRAR